MFGLGILFNLSVSAGTQVLVTGIILRKKIQFYYVYDDETLTKPKMQNRKLLKNCKNGLQSVAIELYSFS